MGCLLQHLFLPTHCKDSPDNKLRHRLPNIWGQMRCTQPRISSSIAKTRLGQAVPLPRHAYYCGQQSSPAACIASAKGPGNMSGCCLRCKLPLQRLTLLYVQALPLFFSWQKQHSLFHVHLKRITTFVKGVSWSYDHKPGLFSDLSSPSGMSLTFTKCPQYCTYLQWKQHSLDRSPHCFCQPLFYLGSNKNIGSVCTEEMQQSGSSGFLSVLLQFLPS